MIGADNARAFYKKEERTSMILKESYFITQIYNKLGASVVWMQR